MPPSNEFELVRLSAASTLSEFSRSRSEGVQSLWLPVTTKTTVDSNEPFVVYSAETKSLTTRRSESMSLLMCLAPRDDVFSLDPKKIPSGLTCFVQCSEGSGTRKIPAGTTVLIRKLLIEDAIAEGSATHPISRKGLYEAEKAGGSSAKASSVVNIGKRGRGGGKSAAANVTIPDDVEDDTCIFSDAYISRSIEEELQRRRDVAAATEESAQVLGGASLGAGDITDTPSVVAEPLDRIKSKAPSHVISDVIDALKKARAEAPLHNAGRGTSTSSIKVGESTWQRHDPRVLVLHHDPTVSESGHVEGSSTKRGVPSILIAGFFVEGGLIQTSMYERGKEAWKLTNSLVPSKIRDLHRQGYRIVLLAHYPSLHHGNLANLEEKCGRIVKCVEEHLSDVPLTVLISVVSNFAGKGQASSFSLPHCGLWNYFVSQYNERSAPDTQRSFLVGGAVPFIRSVTGRLSSKDLDDANSAREACSADYVAEGTSAEAMFAASSNVKFLSVQQLLDAETTEDK